MQCYFMILVFTVFDFFIVKTYTLQVNNFDNNSNNTNDDEEENSWFWNKEDYPNPYEKPPYCKRTRLSSVCDPDQILTRKEANRLDDLIKEATNVSVCFCSYCPPNKRGISIGIALMKHIFKEYNMRDLENAENFANYIRKRWDFGVCDNNMIILVVTSDDQIAVSQGSTTQRVFPQFAIDDAIIKNKIHFVNGNYFQGLESIINNYSHILKNDIQFSPAFIDTTDNNNENSSQSSSNMGLVTGLIIGFVVMLSLIFFILFYVRKRFSEDGSKFQFKGMLSKGYWLNKNERLRPVSLNPISTVGGVYEPCSIEEANENDADKRLREKLSQISECSSSSDEEEIGVIEHNGDPQTRSMDHRNNSNIEQTSVNVEHDNNQTTALLTNHDLNTRNSINT